MMDCIACIDETPTGPVSPPPRYCLWLLSDQLATDVASIGRVDPPALVLEIHCRNSYSIDGVKCTRARPILPAG